MLTDNTLFGVPISDQLARLLAVEAVLAAVAAFWMVLFNLRACRGWRPFLGYSAGLTLGLVILVGVMGLRGDRGGQPPWHVFLDMKYQPKYTAQGQSPYFADGRSMRGDLSKPQFIDGRVAFAGKDYFSDAGLLAQPDPKFARLDDEFYRGRKVPLEEVDEMIEGKPSGRKLPVWLERVPLRKLAGYAARFRDVVGKPDDAGAESDQRVFAALLDRGEARYRIHCAVCHGPGGGKPGETTADGITSRYGMIGVANYHTPRLRQTGDGDLFNTITNGKGTMMPYSSVVDVEDRWAIVTYIRALQMAGLEASEGAKP